MTFGPPWPLPPHVNDACQLGGVKLLFDENVSPKLVGILGNARSPFLSSPSPLRQLETTPIELDGATST
jgi:hypothetical protein